MATQTSPDCLQASLAGARTVASPAKLIRGNEQELISAVLPMVETSGVILDMSSVRVIDAAGVGSLLTLRQVAERFGNTLSLINPTRRTRDLLRMLGLDTVLLCKGA